MSVRGDLCWRRISFADFPNAADVLHMRRSDVLPQGMEHLLQKNLYGGVLEHLFHS